MDAFSLLKFWRTGGGFGGSRALAGRPGCDSSSSSSGRTTILAVSSPHFSDSGSDVPPESDEGRFIDLEFTTAPEDKGRGDDGEKADQRRKKSQHAVGDDDDDDGSGSDESYGENEEEGALNLTFSAADSSSGSSAADPYSSDDIFFNAAAGLFPVEPSSSDARGAANAKFPASLVKKAAKFRVLMLKLNKPRANNAEKKESGGTNPGQKDAEEDEEDESPIGTEKRPLTVRFTVVEEIEQKSNAEEKKFSREPMEKYLNFVRPLYVRVSRRYGGEKLGFSGGASLNRVESKAEKGETDPAADKSSAFRVRQGLRGLREHLIKSRTAAPSPGAWSSRRRDDSLLQQEDGIQGAILHCKRSFHSTGEDSNVSQENPVNMSDDLSSLDEPGSQTG
ncbi:unnamed protein product [Cuscuta campestris]|uniref:Membrane-associated kinase regulator 2 n=1 Tax=Cuscuta campestris TaxID=132261 RepID=A0A484MNW8_9ASTE|nr:unnamed protein product [Cuscuta campestris]VFQ89787.1 unnamed protein product [Cuscuta campestris]